MNNDTSQYYLDQNIILLSLVNSEHESVNPQKSIKYFYVWVEVIAQM